VSARRRSEAMEWWAMAVGDEDEAFVVAMVVVVCWADARRMTRKAEMRKRSRERRGIRLRGVVVGWGTVKYSEGG